MGKCRSVLLKFGLKAFSTVNWGVIDTLNLANKKEEVNPKDVIWNHTKLGYEVFEVNQEVDFIKF